MDGRVRRHARQSRTDEKRFDRVGGRRDSRAFCPGFIWTCRARPYYAAQAEELARTIPITIRWRWDVLPFFEASPELSSRITGSPLLARLGPAFGGGADRRCEGTWDCRIGQADVLSQNMDHEITETSPIGTRQGLQPLLEVNWPADRCRLPHGARCGTTCDTFARVRSGPKSPPIQKVRASTPAKPALNAVWA